MRDKIGRLEKKAAKTEKKLENLKKKIPKKRHLKPERKFDPETKKVTYKITTELREKSLKEPLIKRQADKLVSTVRNKAHAKISEVEQENSAVEAAHKGEKTVESIAGYVKKYRGTKHQRLRKKVKKLNKKSKKINKKLNRERFLKENPEYKKQRHERIKKLIRKKWTKQEVTEKLKDMAKKGASKLLDMVIELIKRKKGLILSFGIMAFLMVIIISSISSCSAMFAGGSSGTIGGSYLSEPVEIDKVENEYTRKELELARKIENIETDHPGFDEYRYNIDPIGHSPYQLESYLSAKNIQFNYAGVESQINDIFSDMYNLTLKHVQETRVRTETRTAHRTIHKPDGTVYEDDYEYEVEVEYVVDVLETTLKVKEMNEIAEANLGDEQKMIYGIYNSTHGNLQQFESPVNLYWYNYVCSYYGHRTNPNTGEEEFHDGIDIALPAGIRVHAGMNGTVTETGEDSYYGKYIKLSDSRGYEIFYAHLSEVLVSDGQEVTQGDDIAKTGESGVCNTPHIHFSISHNGEYYNPAFYFDAEQATLYGEGPDEENVEDIPGYDGDAGRRIIEEGKKYLNYPYVWGGSTPATSFDCSGFVCWSVTHSGVRNIPRTSAQGIYDLCTPISASEAKPGDLVFFTRTYNSGTPVSHVGIYCGNNIMLHCGDPIKYTRITTTYWTNHFYGFGRP